MAYIKGHNVPLKLNIEGLPPKEPSLTEKSTTLNIKGKNLFDKSKSTNDGIKNETAVAISATVVMENDALIQHLEPNVKYTLSYEVECLSVPENATCIETAVGVSMRNRGISGTIVNPYFRQLKAGDVINRSVTFTISEERYTNGRMEMLAYCNNYTDNTTGAYVKPSMIIRNIQIEAGTTATDYERHIEHQQDPTETKITIPKTSVGTGESGSVDWNDENILTFSTNTGVDNLKVTGLFNCIAFAPVIDGQIEIGDNAEVFWIEYFYDNLYFTTEFTIVDGVLNFHFVVARDEDIENNVLEGWQSCYETILNESQKITGFAIKTIDPDNSWITFEATTEVQHKNGVNYSVKPLALPIHIL